MVNNKFLIILVIAILIILVLIISFPIAQGIPSWIDMDCGIDAGRWYYICTNIDNLNDRLKYIELFYIEQEGRLIDINSFDVSPTSVLTGDPVYLTINYTQYQHEYSFTYGGIYDPEGAYTGTFSLPSKLGNYESVFSLKYDEEMGGIYTVKMEKDGIQYDTSFTHILTPLPIFTISVNATSVMPNDTINISGNIINNRPNVRISIYVVDCDGTLYSNPNVILINNTFSFNLQYRDYIPLSSQGVDCEKLWILNNIIPSYHNSNDSISIPILKVQ